MNIINRKIIHMKKFLLLTQSESGDDYHYFILSTKKPTNKQINAFLREHGSDFDDEQTYENVVECLEIKDENFIEIKN